MATHSEVMELRVKEVLDMSSFWAQIGTVKHLADFDDQQSRMSVWCEACETGCLETTSSLKKEIIVAMRGASRGMWVRAKIIRILSDRLVEVFHVDTGVTEYAEISSVCAGTPPMLRDIPQQALQCSLSGVEMLEGMSDWSIEAVSHFIELVSDSTPTKALVHKITEDNCVVISIFAPYKNKFTSVGEILRKEGLARHEPCSPLTLDLPVPPSVTPKSTGNHDHDSFSDNSTSKEGKHFGSCIDQVLSIVPNTETTAVTKLPSSVPINAHCHDHSDSSARLKTPFESPTSSACPKTPLESPPSSVHLKTPFESPPLEADSIPEYLDSPPLLITEVSAKESTFFSKSEAVKSKSSPKSQENTQEVEVVKKDERKSIEQSVLLEGVSSGSSLSDNDWDDLLPHRSGNSEISDVVIESPQKDTEPEVLTGTYEVMPETGLAKSPPANHQSLSSRRNFLLGIDNLGNTPRPRPLPWKSHAPYSTRNLTETFQDLAKEPQRRSWGQPRGRGQRKAKSEFFGGGGGGGGSSGRKGYMRSDMEEREKPWSMPNKGRGKRGGSQDKVRLPHHGGLLPNPPPQFPPGPVFPVMALDSSPVTLATVVPPPKTSYSQQMAEKEAPKDSPAWSPPKTSYSQQMAEKEAPSSFSQPTREEGVTSYSRQILKVTEEDATSYSHQIRKMTEKETADEVKWQEWKLGNAMEKVLIALDSETAKQFGEEVEKLLHSSRAEKLRELPKCRHPLEVIVEYVIKKCVDSNLDLTVVVTAIESMMGVGSYEADLLQIWPSVVEKMASQMTEPSNTGKCHAFCHFLGSLVTSFTPSNSSKYRDTMVASVSSCLIAWSQFTSLESHQSEQQRKGQVECFGCLLDAIDLADNKTVWKELVLQLLNGPIRDCVLCDGYPKYIRVAWYNEISKIVVVAFSDDQLPFQPQPTTDENDKPVVETEVPSTHDNMEPSKETVVGVLHHGLEFNHQLQREIELNQQQLQQGIELNQQVNQEDQLRQEQVLVAYSHSYSSSPHIPDSPVNIPPPAHPLLANMAPQEVHQYPPYHNTSGSGGNSSDVLASADSYTRVVMMLDTLHMMELFPKFRAAMIKDSVLDYDILKVKECLKDAGIPSGPIVEIMHYLECSKQLGGTHRHNHRRHSHYAHLSDHPTYATPHSYSLSQPSSPATPPPPPLAPNTPTNQQHHYFSNPVPTQQQAITPYQMANSHVGGSPTSYAPYDTAPPKGVCYMGGPASPLATYHHLMLPPTVGNKATITQTPPPQQQPQFPQPPPQQQQQQPQFPQPPPQQPHSSHSLVLQQASNHKVVPASAANVGSPATGQRLHKSDSIPAYAMPPVRPSPAESARKPCSSSAASLSSQLQEKRAAAAQSNSKATVAGFGCVRCVVCGGMDHVTYNCTQRGKFFTHM